MSEEKIRVGFLTPTLLFGGAERWVAALAYGLDRSRFDVMGVALRDKDKVFPAIGHKVKCRCPILEGLGSFETLAAATDVLIVWGLQDLSMLRGYHGKVVMVAHGHCQWTVNAIKACLPQVTHWTAVSKHATTSYPDPSKVTVIHNGIETDRCKPKQTREEVRRSWGLSWDDVAIGYVGRLSSEKNWPAVCVASSTLGSGQFRPIVVGDGFAREKQLARVRPIDPGLIYREPVENVGEIYQALDCFLLASPAEGFSLALTEAWYCRCPTVSTPVGATELMDMHGIMGWQVPVAHTPKDLATMVLQAIAPGNGDIIEHAHEVVAKHYTSEAMCRRWDEYLASIFVDDSTESPKARRRRQRAR